MNVCSVLEHHADRFGDRLAVEFDGDSYSYERFYHRIQVAAGALSELGIERGDSVAIVAHNCLEILDLLYGTAYLGATFVPINWRLSGPEIAYIVQHSESRVLVTGPELMDRVQSVANELRGCRVVGVGASAVEGLVCWADLLEGAEPPIGPVEVDGDELHRLMYTSGTTSRPKGVMISHANVAWKNAVHAIELGIGAHERALACGPLYHVGALDLTTTTVFHAGGANYVLPRFDATQVLDAIERNRITAIWLAPAMVNQLLADPSLPSRDLESVRVIIDGGEKMPLPLIDAVHASFPNAWFADAYGLTETVSGDTFLDKRLSRSKPGSVGKPVIYHEVRILSASGEPTPAGVTGEIAIRGPKVTSGYWRDPEATAAAIRDGWFRTGDVGILDDDGYLFVVDRLKDVIISGGENIASLEVERVLYEHSGVFEAAVIGARHERWGEVPVAYVVASDVAEPDLLSFCAERLAKFKVPARIRFIDSLPRNPSGKVLKRELREREAAAQSVPLPEANPAAAT
jgi:fatty-acyl-CoA synthase